jgi:hypothetical protein
MPQAPENCASQNPSDETQQKILRFASTYAPRQISGYEVHNEFFCPQERFSSTDLAQLRAKLHHLGTFTVITNARTGLIQTSDTTNAAMRRQWFTDSVMAGYMQKELDPLGWAKALLINAAALCSQDARQAVTNTEADPDWYRKGGLMNGVFHIYLPESVRFGPDDLPIVDTIKKSADWFNQKRLESQALMLIALCEMILESCKDAPAEWAIPFREMTEQKGELVISAAALMTRFLIAANSDKGEPNFETPSASSWEEAPFEEGMSSDATFTVLGLERLCKVLYAPTDNKKLLSIREFITANPESIPHPPCEEVVRRWIVAGRFFIHNRIVAPLAAGLPPIQTPSRPADTALTLLAASDYDFYPGEPKRNAEVRLGLIRFCNATLLGEHGMRRYNEFELQSHKLHDSYLNVNYHLSAEVRAALLDLTPDAASSRNFGSSDASDLESLVDRQRTSRPEWAAQWTIGLTASLQALAKAKLEILTCGSHNDEARLLLEVIDDELQRAINRSIASIPGKLSTQPALRADGNVVTPYQVIEAFEYVLFAKGRGAFIPGAHTLPWSTAQLYDGLRRAEEAERLAE